MKTEMILTLAMLFNFGTPALACKTPQDKKIASEPFFATTAKPATELYDQIMLQMHSKMEEVPTKGQNYDKQFLRLMIPHHEAAVQMAQVILLHTKDTKIKNLALSIIADQQNEIAFMKTVLQ